MKKMGNEKTALHLVEEAVQILRQGGLELALPYLAGTIPFLLGLLYFVSDMSTSPYAQSHLIAFSLVLALLFLWMKSCHLLFTQSILAILYGQKSPRLIQILKIMPAQALVHSLGFIALPIAGFFMFPLGWTFAFFQNILCIDLSRQQGLTSVCSLAWRQTVLWPKQNHLILFYMSVFSLAIWLNIAVFLLFLPFMLKILLAVDSQFILSPYSSVYNSTFLCSSLGLTYLCLDPFIKAVYTLRCYYGGSITSGEDIKARLRRLNFSKAALAIVAACLLCVSPAGPGLGDDSPQARHAVSQPQLEESIHEVMQRPVFSWRLPQEILSEPVDEEPGFMAKAARWIRDKINEMFSTIGEWIRKVWIWLEDLLPDFEFNTEPKDDTGSSIDWAEVLKVSLWGLLIIALSIMMVLVIKIWKTRARMPKNQVQEAEPVPEVNILDEEVTADLLATNAWLDLAREMMAKGAYLEALRAFYLAALAHLSRENMISIARYKSNHEYKNELARRARDKTELLDLFSGSVRIFEKHWYGMYPVDETIVGEFALSQERIMRFVQNS